MESISDITLRQALGVDLFSNLKFVNEVIEKIYVERLAEGAPHISLNRKSILSNSAEPELFEVHYLPWRDHHDRILGGFVRVRRQVKTIQLDEDIAQAADEKFKIMADCAPVLLWMAGLDARCLFFNQRWLNFSGRTMEQEFGFQWAEGVHHEDFQNCIDVYMRAFNARREFVMEYRLKRHDGQYRWLLDIGRPYRDANGAFAGYIGSCVDITLLKEAKQNEIEKVKLETQVAEREKAAKELKIANDELEAFAYMVSHDLRAPLRCISGFSNALAEAHAQQLDAGAKGLLDRIHSGTVEMKRLIDDILAFSHANRFALEKRKTNPNSIVKVIFEELFGGIARQNVSVVLEDLPDCQADPDLLKQVYVNLLDNALKYTKGKDLPRIEVGSIPIENEIVYFVRDNGAGFDMKDVDKLFGVFQRLHSSDQFEGTGLGLAIVQRIIQRHGGRIWAESQVDQGSTFYFTLPNFTPRQPIVYRETVDATT